MIVEVPCATPAAIPVALTVATDVVLDAQATSDRNILQAAVTEGAQRLDTVESSLTQSWRLAGLIAMDTSAGDPTLAAVEAVKDPKMA